jgi:hypothetical protein
MRDAIIFSGFTWETFNVPERISLALAELGCRVLHCVTPNSILRNTRQPLREISARVHTLQLRFISSRLNYVPGGALAQARMMRRQIDAAARELGLRNPIFFYSGLWRLLPLCALMKRDHFTVHMCIDHSGLVDPQYDRYVEMSDKTLTVPKSCYHKYKARYGDKIDAIPQSGNVREVTEQTGDDFPEPPALSKIPRPRLGYWGTINRRVNVSLASTVLRAHPEWHFISVRSIRALPLPNAHWVPWEPPERAAPYVRNLDVGFMPYNCHDEEALHCVPLKLLDHFAFGTPVVSTPIVHLWEYKDLVYLGDSAEELAGGIKAALSEPLDSPKRAARMAIARKYSLGNLATVLRQCLPLKSNEPIDAALTQAGPATGKTVCA